MEERADCSVFLSWAWIGSLLEIFRPRLELLSVRRGGDLVALAVAGAARRGAALHLNEVGDTAIDGIMIEYNGLLAVRGEEDAAARVSARLVVEGKAGELRLSGVPSRWPDLCDSLSFDWRLLRPRQPAPYCRLDRFGSADPLNVLSKNSREQSRRSLRLFESLGPVRLRRAASADQALEWFGSLERLHSATWASRGKSGAFARPEFGRFHRHLIATRFHEGVPDLLRLEAGDLELGYLYNLRWRDAACAYQSGFASGDDPRWRPGMIAHLLALRLYRDEGFSFYRFLAGDARYKNVFADGKDELYWIAAYRPSLSRSAAALLRRLRQSTLGVLHENPLPSSDRLERRAGCPY